MDVVGESEYRLLESPDGAAPLAVVATLAANTVSYDLTVPLSRRIGARYVLRACNGVTCNDSSSVTVAGSLAGAIGYFKASNTGAGDAFGQSVAISADGNTLAVGAPYEDSDAAGVGGNQGNDAATDSGAVYIFTRSGSAWSQQAYVKASNAEAADLFAVSLALSADGNTLAVGAENEDSSATGVGGNQSSFAAFNSGAVYIFSRTGSAWSQQAYVKASNTDAEDSFGAALALSSDGSTLAVGARFEDSNATGVGGNQTDNTALASGAVYVFSRSGATWTQEAYVKASNTQAADFFGVSVALSADGNTLAVGAQNEDSSATGVGGNQTADTASNSGAVYLFSRNGAAWAQQAYVKASNTGAGDSFGKTLSLSADGATLGVGAPNEDSNATGVGGNESDDSEANSGAVYVFYRSGTTWSQQTYVKASNTGAGDLFGFSVTLSADGATLAVGAPQEDGGSTGLAGSQVDSANDSGAAYLFSRSGAAWTQRVYVKASNTHVFDSFGNSSLGLSSDGNTLAVAAPAEASSATGVGGNQSDYSLSNSGAVYVY